MKVIVGIAILFTVLVQCRGTFAESSSEEVSTKEKGIKSLRKVSYPCHRLKCKPTLDGKINNDPAWKTISLAEGKFLVFNKDFPADKQTSFKIGYTPEAFYIAVKCMEPNPENIIAKAKDGGDLFREDSIEIFILPKGSETYYQFAVNALGSRWTNIPLNWKAAAYTGKDFWSAEVEIPFENLNDIPCKNDVWTGNICRNNPGGPNRHSTWAKLLGSFHDPDNFGKIIFEDSISHKEKITVEKEIVNSLKEKVLANLDEAKDFVSQYPACSIDETRLLLEKSSLFLNELTGMLDFGMYLRDGKLVMMTTGQKFTVDKHANRPGWLQIDGVPTKRNEQTIRTNHSD